MEKDDLIEEEYYVREVELVYKERSHWMPMYPLLRPESAGQALGSLLDHQPQERFGVLALDVRLRPIAYYNVAKGSMTASLVHPREVFRTAISLGSNSIIIAHSHPSGDVKPSNEDFEITAKLQEAGVQLGIAVVDHIIVAAGRYYSFAENDKIRESANGDTDGEVDNG